MELFNRLKQYLGFPTNNDNFQNRNGEIALWNLPNDERQSLQGRNFNMFTDPLEIHKYFEQQMTEMLRNFGFHEFTNPETNSVLEQFPNFDESPLSSTDLRSQFLKPGYENKIITKNSEKTDRDLDGESKLDLNTIFKGDSNQLKSYENPTPKVQFFGQSMSTRTIRNADGSIETHQTMRDNNGNEETTITRKLDNQEYTVIKRKNRDGKEEITENFLNIDEKDKDKFITPQLDQEAHNWFPFIKLF